MAFRHDFAARTRTMTRSTVRELLKLTTQPDMISFAGGLPAPELLPIDEVRSATEHVLLRHGAQALQYGETEGLGELRDWVAESQSRAGQRFTRENVCIVSGSQQGIDLIGRVLLDPADRVLVENPTYLAMLCAWRTWDAEFVPVASDAGGLCADDLARAAACRPKLLYCVPSFQNPQGTTLCTDRRADIVRLAISLGFAIVEDDPYGMLRYAGPAPPSLLELAARTGDADHVIRLGTFSKVLAPGLRVGWVLAAPQIIDKLVQAKQSTDLHTSTLCQEVVMDLLREGVLERHLPLLLSAYGERLDAMLEALEKHFPARARWTRPEGGMFVMVRLGTDGDTRALLPKALDKCVAFVPGADFHLEGKGRDSMRLNFSHVPPERIRVGIARLAQCMREL